MTGKTGPVSITAATKAERDSVFGVITLSFSTDPVVRWIFADPGVYLSHAAAYIDAFGGAALDHGSAFRTEAYRGAALWLPPGVKPDEDRLAALFDRTVPATRRRILHQVLTQMEAATPAMPHWHLPLIGIDPAWQNQGIGSLLMRHAGDMFDRLGVAAYLESSSERNIPFYQRLGYQVLRTIRVGDCPPISPMLRLPRPIRPACGT
jgi:GNAT superfamily N-acetyltransferase